jgi:hypothetical protein
MRVSNSPIEDCFVPRNDTVSEEEPLQALVKSVIASNSAAIFDKRVSNLSMEISSCLAMMSSEIILAQNAA